ncbi:MAG TPA: hypothetical protein PLG90_10575 [Ignavibacteria bacterium]|nr:hypothetical protein [Ignavibacteria bacterium]
MNIESSNNGKNITICNVCGEKVQLIFVHGHYQCPKCKQVVVSCCENEDTCEQTIKKEKDTE